MSVSNYCGCARNLGGTFSIATTRLGLISLLFLALEFLLCVFTDCNCCCYFVVVVVLVVVVVIVELLLVVVVVFVFIVVVA